MLAANDSRGVICDRSASGLHGRVLGAEPFQ
jgi:hypothetical protein